MDSWNNNLLNHVTQDSLCNGLKPVVNMSVVPMGLIRRICPSKSHSDGRFISNGF